MIAKELKMFTLSIYFVIFLDFALGMALPGNKIEPKEAQVSESVVGKQTVTTTATTVLPTKALANENESNQKFDSKFENLMEKPQKRGILQELYYNRPLNHNENGFETNDEETPRKFFPEGSPDMETGSFFQPEEPEESVLPSDDGYFENDGRQKRTAMIDEIYGRPQEYPKSETELSPDDVMALLSLLKLRRFYSSPWQSRWPDYDSPLDPVETDMREEDVFKDNDGDSYVDNSERYPAGMKRYMISRRKKSNYLGNPKLRVPLYRRAIL